MAEDIKKGGEINEDTQGEFLKNLLRKELMIPETAPSSTPDSDIKDDILAITRPQLGVQEDIFTERKESGPSQLERLISMIDAEVGASYGEAGLPVGAEDAASREQVRELEQFIVFSLSGAKYAVPILNVVEVGSFTQITYVPNVPGWLVGVTNLRGDILSVVSLRSYFGFGDFENLERQQMIVAKRSNEELLAALVVDDIDQIVYIGAEDIVSPTGPVESELTRYMRGIYQGEDEIFAVLDIDALLNSMEIF